MKQYCRYCVYALDYDGALICTTEAPCGNNGSGKMYNISKAKTLNKCKWFEFNPNDLLRQNPDGSFMQYKPKKPKYTQEIDAGQISIGGVE